MAEEIENASEAERVDFPPAAEKSILTLPFSLTLAALVIYFGFQTLQLLNERSNLILVKSTQEAAIQEAQKVQAQFKTLVSKISELAEKGHAGAKMVMEELLNRGVSAAPETKSPGATETKPVK
ncbi:MAG TPA: hypothetical protein VGB09_09365 [Candidatus Binatia bacterium]|jgi:hypothetical protein